MGQPDGSLLMCDVVGCPNPKRPRRRTGTCQTHYTRFLRTGDVQADNPIQKRDPARGCTVPGCERRHNAKGLCKLHHERARKFGPKCLTFPDECRICRSTANLVVDHDHRCCRYGLAKTCGNCARGILCSSCNKAVGFFKDDVSRLKAAIAYLEES